MARDVPELTPSVEDYLKAVWSATQQGGAAATSEIAARLGVSSPSVSGMIRRLSDGGLVERTPYRGVALTDEGRRAALRTIRRHRVVETFLVRVLGLEWDEVHVEAERLEHAVSDRVLERMAGALGDPEFDPHGDPIPTPDGRLPEARVTALTDVAHGRPTTIRRVLTSEPERLRYLSSLGLVPGAEVTVVDREPFQGPVRVRIGGGLRSVGEPLAAIVLCGSAERSDD